MRWMAAPGGNASAHAEVHTPQNSDREGRAKQQPRKMMQAAVSPWGWFTKTGGIGARKERRRKKKKKRVAWQLYFAHLCRFVYP